ncbi:hypothetical protein RFI_03056 [Reticulomyxa filosa]|uniref:Uncharacterized protein n=1 Tax=Reticulomyxa filosa TaxID=46433 RepID=X6P7D9_RETFI|nr:hypothetical protein RFI_03056 [Reticulomyxa filosa]|eukprot:ETO34038.1 hypothetical protein RFI_03056 [Reticulomyxa filosa]
MNSFHSNWKRNLLHITNFYGITPPQFICLFVLVLIFDILYDLYKSKYFGKLKAIDKALSPLEALSSQFRKSWNGFIEESFAQSDIAAVSSVISIVQDATSVVDVKTEKSAKELVDEIWNILDFGSHSLSPAQATLCGNLFLERAAVTTCILVNADLARLKVLRQAVQIKDYLKNNSISRLLLGVLINQFPIKFAPLFTQESALQSFVTQNQTSLETYASQLKTLYGAQETFAESLQQFKDFIRESTNLNCCAISNAFGPLKSHVKLTDQCPLVISLESAAKRAQEKGDIHAELKLKSTVKYLKTSKNVSWYKLFRTINAPRRGEFCGDGLEAISTYAATNGNEAFETLFKGIVGSLKSHALLSSDVNKIKSSLAKQWEQVQKNAVKVNEARINSNNALYQIQLQHDDLNFNRIKDNYNPLDIYLSNYNYF